MDADVKNTDSEQFELDTNEIMQSISAVTLLEELKNGHNTFSILLLTVDGRVIYANKIAVNGFAGETTESIKGKSIFACGPKEWMDERVGFLKKAAASDRPLVVVEAIEGVRLVSRFAAISAMVNGTQSEVVLLTIEPIIATDFEWLSTRKDYHVIMANCIDLGRLNILSDREIEVLALMGQGLRQKDIAKQLCRSVSTINRHRESIGEKLNITDRAQIIRLANIAILQVDDAKRKRIVLNPLSDVHMNKHDFKTVIIDDSQADDE